MGNKIIVKLWLPPDLLEAVDKQAEKKGRSRSAQIRETLLDDPEIYQLYEETRNALEKTQN